MDVSNIHLERISRRFDNDLRLTFGYDLTEVTHTLINLRLGFVSPVPSDYHWHLQYWANDLDLSLSERIRSGIHSWDGYSAAHGNALKKNDKRLRKIDICTPCPDGFEILSVSQCRDIEFTDFLKILQIKSIVSRYANAARKKSGAQILLPLRSSIEPTFRPDSGNIIEFPLGAQHDFNGVRLTSRELDTVRLLLELRSIKEISAMHQCSATAEWRRLNRIKEKFDCANMPLSKLFQKLKSEGVTRACLNTYITFP